MAKNQQSRTPCDGSWSHLDTDLVTFGRVIRKIRLIRLLVFVIELLSDPMQMVWNGSCEIIGI